MDERKTNSRDNLRGYLDVATNIHSVFLELKLLISLLNSDGIQFATLITFCIKSKTSSQEQERERESCQKLNRQQFRAKK